MDHGVIPLIQMFDGNTAKYLDVHLEVNLIIKRTYARAKEYKWKWKIESINEIKEFF